MLSLQRYNKMKKFKSIILAILAFCISAAAQWDKDVFLLRGQLALQDGKYANAIEQFNVLARLDTTNYWNFFYRGIAKYNLGDYRGAYSDFNRTVSLNPVFTNGYHFRAITESSFGEYETALKDLEKALSLRPGNISVIFSRGVTNFLARNFENALKDFDYYISKEKKDAAAYLNRGATYLFLGDTLKALDNYNTAIKLDRHDAEGYIRRGRVYAMQNDYDNAVRDMNLAIERDPDNTLALFTRAVMNHEKYNYNAAMDDFNKVLDLEPGNALTLYNRGLLSAQVGDYEAALSDIGRVIAINPDNVLAHYNRAAIYMELGRFQDAVEDYSRAIALYPDFANAYLNRSVAQQRLGRMDASKSDYNTAKKKIDEYKASNNKSAGSYADTTKKYSALLRFDAEFAKKDFNDELLQNREIDGRLRPLYRFAPSGSESSATFALEGKYENMLLDYFLGNCPLAIALVNRSDAQNAELEHSIEYILAGDSAAGAGVSDISESEVYFIKGLYEILGKRFNNALECFDKAVLKADTDAAKDKYSRYYKAFYLLNRGVLKADMINFIASINSSVQTLTMDDKKTTRTRVSDRIKSNYDYSEAIEDIVEAIRILPQFPFSYFNLANLYCLSEKPVEAIDNYSKALGQYPYFGDAYFNRGLVQISVKDFEKGCIDLSKAGELGVSQAYGMIKKYCSKDDED